MLTRAGIRRVPWERIAIVLTCALITAWTIGYAIGMVVNFFIGIN
ncbi:MAG TPA: hypothetical protein VH740_10805 [Vicinamibacterales bacterium]|jgi:hypothetical protein